MKPIVARVNIKLGEFTIARVTLADTYLASARGLMQGLQVLAVSSESTGMAMTFLAGHILECLLKAILLGQGVAEGKVKGYSHMVQELWRQCADLGALPKPSMPPWAERLGALHDKPFILRYLEGVHGLVLPAKHPMVAELQEMLELAEKR